MRQDDSQGDSIDESSVRNPWVMTFEPRPAARVRLFCLPYAGAGASAFRDWSGGLSTEIEVRAIQLPGRETRIREEPLRDLRQVADRLVEALRSELERPFALYGHSIGSLVAFELARRLEALGSPTPLHLIVAGHHAPQLPMEIYNFSRLADEELIVKLRELNGTPSEVFEEPELLQLLLPVLRADFELCDSYTYQPSTRLRFPISAYGGIRDPYMTRAGLAAWQEQTAARCNVRIFPGDHFFPLSDQSLVLRAIAEDLLQPFGR